MFKAKKSLGQNWLKSESAIREIIKAADLKEGEEVLEIGPGKGVLTKALIETGAKVLAIEKDNDLIAFLQEKFTDEIKTGKLILIHDDVLKLNFSKTLLTHETKSRGKNTLGNKTKYKLVANIPYYITGQVIRKFLSEEDRQPSQMVLMVQKEVAKRITVNPSTSLRVTDKESLLSLSVKAYGEPKYIKTVPAGAFDPKPNVDSAILLIANISRNFFGEACPERSRREEKFFEILKKGFSQKRKLLKSNLGVGEEVLVACNIPAKARAENLTLENWYCLTRSAQ